MIINAFIEEPFSFNSNWQFGFFNSEPTNHEKKLWVWDVLFIWYDASLYTSDVIQRASELIAVNPFKSGSTVVAILVAEEVSVTVRARNLIIQN